MLIELQRRSLEVLVLTRILVPFDESDLSDRLLDTISHFDLAEDAEVILLHVVNDRAPRTVERRSRELLSKKADAFHESGVRARVEVLAGDPAKRIVECAVECGATVVVMLMRGKTGPPAWMRGSVAERVLRESPIPLLLEDPDAATRHDHAPGVLRRILVPVDPRHMESTEHVIPLVLAMARRQDAVVQLLAVVDESGPDALSRRAEAEACLEAVHARLVGIATLKRVAVGSPDGEILEAAADGDLVAISAQRDPRSIRTLFGTTAEGVLRRCPCPVLVVPPPMKHRGRR